MVERLRRADVPGWVRGRLAGRTGTRWVGIDGLGAAGKTTLAATVARALPGSVVVPVDDFARAGLRGWNRELFAREVLEPMRAGRPGRYQRWDLVAEAGREWVEVPSGAVVVVEGVSATDVRVPVPWDATLWLDVPAAERERRIRLRDTDRGLLERWRTDWWPNEQAYAAEQRPWERVDAVVDGSSCPTCHALRVLEHPECMTTRRTARRGGGPAPR